MFSSGFTTYVGFALYLALVFLIAFIAFAYTKNLSDYVLGGRSLNGPVAALSAGASDMSSWLLLALPGSIYLTGSAGLLIVFALLSGACISWIFIAKPLRIYSAEARNADSLTIPAFLDNRLHDDSKKIRLVASLALIFFFTFYIASGLVASGLLLQQLFNFDYIYALLLASSIITLYTLVGGFLAVSWTDFFQGSLMMLCLLLVPLMAYQQIDGSQIVLTPLSFPVKSQFINTLGTLSWGLGYLGMPHILVRYMSVKSTKVVKIAATTCLVWMLLAMLGAVATGYIGRIIFTPADLSNHEMVFVQLAQLTFSPWLVGVIIAAILSSAMCAIDSQVLAVSSAISEDIYRVFLSEQKASQAKLIKVSRIAVAVVVLCAILLSLKPSQSIMHLVSFAWAGLGATFGPVVILSLYWSKLTRYGTISSMITGAATCTLWHFTLQDVCYSMLPAFTLAFLAAILVSTLDTNKPDSQVLADFKKYRSILAKS